MDLLKFVVLFAVIVRHIPQFVIDFRNRKRKVVKRATTPVKANHIMLAYVVVLATFLGGNGSLGGTEIFRVVGLSTFFTGLALGMIGLWTLRNDYREEILIYEDSRLHTRGIYGIVRHPMRLGLALELLALILISGQWFLASVWIVVVISQVIRTAHENAFLCEVYGERALSYQETVPSINVFAGLKRRFMRERVSRWSLP